MPDALIHFALPFALSTYFFSLKKALLIGLIALLPDIDVVFHIHRSITHSLVLLIIPSMLFLYKNLPFKKEVTAIILSLMSHSILDSFQTYTPILYPIIKDSIFIKIHGGLLMGNEVNPYIRFSINAVPVDFAYFTSLDAILFTGQSLFISTALITIPIISNFLKFKRTNSKNFNSKNFMPLKSISFSQNIESLGISPDDVTIVIPTLNEAEAIGKVIDELKMEGYKNILVVDGYSIDGTPNIAIEKGAKVIFQHGSGKAGAIMTAIENIHTPYMLVMDGDGTYDPKDIKRLLLHANKYDEILGMRANRENIPMLHRFGNWIINLVFRNLLDSNLSDVCSGMYLIKTKALQGIRIGRGFNVDVEIAAHMSYSGRITEVPISYRKRMGEKKLKSIRDGLSIFATIVQLSWIYNPIFTFAALASLLIIPGAIISFWQLYLRYAYGMWSVGLSWLGLILLVIGLNCLTISILSLQLRGLERRIVKSLERSSKSN